MWLHLWFSFQLGKMQKPKKHCILRQFHTLWVVQWHNYWQSDSVLIVTVQHIAGLLFLKSLENIPITQEHIFNYLIYKHICNKVCNSTNKLLISLTSDFLPRNKTLLVCTQKLGWITNRATLHCVVVQRHMFFGQEIHFISDGMLQSIPGLDGDLLTWFKLWATDRWNLFIGIGFTCSGPQSLLLTSQEFAMHSSRM